MNKHADRNYTVFGLICLVRSQDKFALTPMPSPPVPGAAVSAAAFPPPEPQETVRKTRDAVRRNVSRRDVNRFIGRAFLCEIKCFPIVADFSRDVKPFCVESSPAGIYFTGGDVGMPGESDIGAAEHEGRRDCGETGDERGGGPASDGGGRMAGDAA